VELAEKVFHDLAGKHALLVGAGENGLHCAQHLLARDVASLTITNRTAARAEALALKLGGEAVPFDQLEQGIAAADIVITTTGSPTPIIDQTLVRRAMRERDHVALVLLDIAVPRDIDVAVDHVPNVFRFDMEALEKITDRNLERRRREIPAVERIVRGEIDNFMRWWASLDAGPVIRALHESFESIRAQELQKNAKRFVERDRAELETFSKNLVRKLLMDVTREIKQYRRDDPVEMERLAALRDVFHLGKNGSEDDSGDPSP
jgi:glutamyl-tRNA reductase